jgi:hypothetical protein
MRSLCCLSVSLYPLLTLQCLGMYIMTSEPIQRHAYTECGISQLTAAHFVGGHSLGN